MKRHEWLIVVGKRFNRVKHVFSFLLSSLVLCGSLSFAQQLVALQQDPKVEKAGTGFAVFKQKRETTWMAVMETMTSYNWRPQTMDSASGVVFFQDRGQWGAYWGSNNNAIARFTTKRVKKSWSSWQAIELQANLVVKPLDSYRTEVRVTTQFAGCNGFQSLFDKYRSCRWEPLETNGQLEVELLERIASKMPELSHAELYPPSKANDKAVVAAREQVTDVQKISAAFELNASVDRVMTALVDAKASLQTFSESPEAQTLPRFTSALNRAVHEFAEAGSGNLNGRPALLESANSSLAQAKKYLANYERYVQEVEPGALGNGMSVPTVAVVRPDLPGNNHPDNSGQSVATANAANMAATVTVPVLRGFIGAESDGNPNIRHDGVELSRIVRGGPADRAGLQAGDFITAVNGRYIFTANELTAAISELQPDSEAEIRFRRRNAIYDSKIIIGGTSGPPTK